MDNDSTFDMEQLIDAIKSHPGLKTDSDREKVSLIFDKLQESGIIKYFLDVYPTEIACIKVLSICSKALIQIFADINLEKKRTNKEIIEDNDLWFVKTVIALHSYDPEKYQLSFLANILDPNIDDDIGETVELRRLRYNIIFLITDNMCKYGILDIITSSITNQNDLLMYILSILDNYIHYVGDRNPDGNNPDEFIMSLLDIEYFAEDYFPELNERLQIRGVRSIEVPHFIKELYYDD